MTEGFLIVDKPSGITSHDVVSRIRKKFNMHRVGHAGTLDPLATGVLVILLGKATKLFKEFSSFSKAYEATLRLGLVTTTADINGTVLSDQPFNGITREKTEEVFRQFLGEIEQVPPMVSAVKFKGKRLYQLARKGIVVERESRRVRIDALHIEQFNLPEVKFYVKCSKGTYVRKIAEDIGEALGCGGCISQIRRVEVGPFRIDQAVTLEDADERHLRNWTY